ncbi:sigma-70 family RNA polymerase sigma factor [Candidatus Poribacteria bacterium]|nr:sigma-70 family RNA polymerase sigma factor [Candidatus Poribacteria bacterium]
MTKENTLIYRAQSGDEEAFADLMRSYHAFVYAIVVGVVDNSHDAEEVVQDAFLNAYQGLSQLEDATKFKNWLAEITRNCARQWLRKQRGETVPLDEVSEEMLQTADSPDERLTRQEQRELIRRTMETLPQKDREIAHAFYLEGASYDELTSTHGLSYNAIAFRLSRAKRQLSKRLQYLLTGIFVSPGLTLKKLYTGGLTVMKVGTVPKITVGAAVLIGLIFISYIGMRQLNAPTVAERVYLSPWEDGTVRPQSSPEGLAAQTDSTQDMEVRDNHPQIASAASAEERELIDDLFGELDKTDLAQFATETEFEPDTDHALFVDTSTLLDDTGQSAEDVMYAYVEAVKNLDDDAMLPLMTEEYRRSIDIRGNYREDGMTLEFSSIDEMPPEILAEMPPEILEVLKTMTGAARKSVSQAEVVSSEYVDDEFHFQLRTPAPKMPEIPDADVEMPTSAGYHLFKMKRVDGMWQIYDGYVN